MVPAVALEWFDKRATPRKPRYADNVRRQLERNLFPDLGNRQRTGYTRSPSKH